MPQPQRHSREPCKTTIYRSNRRQPMKRLFYTEIKNAQGEYEPLGVMTMEDAFKYAWAHDHATVKFTEVRALSPAGTAS